MKKNLSNFIVALCLLIFISGCVKEDSEQVETFGDLNFILDINDKNEGARTLNMNDTDAILITIKKNDGSATQYSTKEIKLYNLNGQFISQKISLPVGNYLLTEFLVIDSEDQVVYATPEKGSLQAQNVIHPLSIDFNIHTDQITALEIEVLSTENLELNDFGLVGFDLSEVKLLRFYINVSEKGNLEDLLFAELTVVHGSYTFNQDLKPIANNSVAIKDGYPSYDILVTSNGYSDYSITLSLHELAQFQNAPLTIELDLENESDSLWVPGMDIIDSRDGEVYKTVQIGDQIWLAENLRSTIFNDGQPIPYIINNTTWDQATTPAYSWYEHDTIAYKNTYGALYNWYVIETQKICPLGWHVPSDAEWDTLNINLGETESGKKLKIDGVDFWGLNNNGTNESGFSALPNGLRINGIFEDIGEYAYFWSTWNNHPTTRHRWELRKLNSNFPGPFSIGKNNGYCIRCMQD
jgi:uncharacterized protein (TIGR02145 family)